MGCQARPEVIIHGEVEAVVQWSHLAPEFRAKKRGLLRNVHVAAAQLFQVGLGSREVADHLAFSVDPVAVTVNHAHLGVVLQLPDRRTDSPRVENVIRVEPRQDLAGGTREALVDGVGLPLVFLALPICQAIGVFLDNFKAAVAGAAIDDDVFNVRIVLLEHAAHGLLEEARLVEGGGDDADFGLIKHAFLPSAGVFDSVSGATWCVSAAGFGLQARQARQRPCV